MLVALLVRVARECLVECLGKVTGLNRSVPTVGRSTQRSWDRPNAFSLLCTPSSCVLLGGSRQ